MLPSSAASEVLPSNADNLTHIVSDFLPVTENALPLIRSEVAVTEVAAPAVAQALPIVTGQVMLDTAAHARPGTEAHVLPVAATAVQVPPVTGSNTLPTDALVLPVAANDVMNVRVQSAVSICRYCNTTAKYLVPHLRQSANCQRKYALSLNLPETASLVEIVRKKKNFDRTTYPSRQKEVRAQEIRLSNDDRSVFNTFVKDNSKFDIDFFTISCAEETDPGSSFITSFDPILVENNRFLRVPGHQEDQPGHIFDSTMLLPISPHTLNDVPANRGPVLRKDLISSLTLGPGNFNVDKYVKGVYEHKMRQFCDRKSVSNIVIGNLVNGQSKLMQVEKECPVSYAKIKGSIDYYKRLKEDLKFAMYQLGSTCLVVRLELEKVNILRLMRIWDCMT